MRGAINTVTVASALFAACAATRPTNGDGAVACDRVDKYTTEWFLQATKPEFAGTLHETGLFYSRGMSDVARSLGRSNEGLTTIWDLWPCELYNHRDEPTNPLRCIHADEKQQLTYFENMSRAFAIKARSFARVLHSAADYASPPMDGIWGRIEYPQLTDGEHVDLLQKLSEDMTRSEVFWKRLQGLVAQLPMPLKFELKKRDLHERGGQCMTEWEYKVFDKLPW